MAEKGDKMEARFKKLLTVLIVLTAGFGPDITYAAVNYPRALLHYEFEGKGNDSPGTFVGDARIISDAERGNVLRVDGKGHYVDCGVNPYSHFTDQLTVACWVKSDPSATGARIPFSKGGSWMVGSSDDGVVFYCNDLKPNERVNGAAEIMDGRWHHIAGVYDESQTHLYVDGVREASDKARGRLLQSPLALWIGADSDPEGELNWIGLIDDAVVFGRALDAKAINLLLSQGPARFVVGRIFEELTEVVQEAEAILKEQEPRKAVAWLEKKVAEHEKWKAQNPDHIVLSNRRPSCDLYYLLAKARSAAAAPKEELVDAYKHAAVESEEFSCLSVPRQGPSLVWLYKNVEAADYEKTIAFLIESNSNFPAAVAAEAAKMLTAGQPEAAMKFLECNMGAYTRWRKQHPQDKTATAEDLPAAYFQLAKAREAAGAPKADIADAYGRTFTSFSGRWSPQQTAALTWLFENDRAKEYSEAIASCAQTEEITVPCKTVIREVCRHFESNDDWPRFELLLDTLFARARHPAEWSVFIESCFKQESGPWAEKYAAYLKRRPRLEFERDCIVAGMNMAEEDFTKAAQLYGDIVDRCGPEDDKGLFQFNLAACLWHQGKYRTSVPVLDSFVSGNKATHGRQVQEALLMKGRCHLHLGQMDQAVEPFLALTIEYPEAKYAPEAAYLVGYCYMLQSAFERATQALDIVIRDYPRSDPADKARMSLARIKDMTEPPTN
jgi:tetratricopeptide (TPR) repeat protein